MNKQNFENENNRFPLSTQSLAFMQDMILASAKLALIGGKNYILSGCERTGNTVTPGVIVINGEVMPFEGGAAVRTITIVETVENVSANGINYENVRVIRKAKFATGNGANYYPWAIFKPLSTNAQLEQAKATVEYVNQEISKIQTGSIPTGVIVMWSGSVSNIPKGWQLCDNTIIPGTNQRTPDLRGKFVVGFNYDDNDYKTIGTMGGSKTVKLKEENTPPHRHLNGLADDKTWPFAQQGSLEQKSSSACLQTEGGTAWWQGYTSVAGEAEPFDIRPPYYVLAFIMKIDVKN